LANTTYTGKKKRSATPAKRFPKKDSLNDLEVAKKMIKIFQSAQDRNLEFDLSFETVKRLLSYQKCYYTDKVFDEEGTFARSFDRIDSNKGYVEGNVVACTIDINSKKSNLSFEEIELLYNKLSEARNNETPDEIIAPDDTSSESEEPAVTGDNAE
jgi:hypothetical protein